MSIPAVPGYSPEELLDAARWWCGAVVAMLQGDLTTDLTDQAVDAGVPPGALIAMGRGHAAFLCKEVAELRGEDPSEYARRFAYGAAHMTVEGPPA